MTSTIDWEAVHRRLAASAAAISGDLERDAEQIRIVLEQRARAAAKPASTEEVGERTIDGSRSLLAADLQEGP